MKNLILIIIFFILYNCKPQSKEEKIKIEHQTKTTTMNTYIQLIDKKSEKFDILRFNKSKNPEDTFYTYKLSDGTNIEESLTDEGYSSSTYLKDSKFVVNKNFYENGNIESKGLYYQDNFQIGIWYEFDENGKFLKQVNYDLPFNYSFEDIEKFCKTNNLEINNVGINRFYDEKTKECYWEIQYTGEYEKKFGNIITIRIDGYNGKKLKVIIQNGKGGEGTTVETVFESKQKK